MHFIKEQIHLANKHNIRYSAQWVIREIPIKTKWEDISCLLHFQKLKAKHVAVHFNMEELGHLSSTGGNVNWCIH